VAWSVLELDAVRPQQQRPPEGDTTYGGLDITVYQSDDRRAPGHLPSQGPPRCAGRYVRPPGAPLPRQPRPRPLPGTGRPDRREPRLPRARAQAPQTELPHPQRPRRPSTRSRRLTPCHAASLKSNDETAASSRRDCGRPSPAWGWPTKNEWPQHYLPEHPIEHHVANPEPARAGCRSKPKRPRTRHPTTRSLTTHSSGPRHHRRPSRRATPHRHNLPRAQAGSVRGTVERRDKPAWR
jgi:hypothetical protein